MTHRGGHSDEHPIKQPRQSAAWPATDAGVSPRPRLFPLPAGDDTGADDVLDLTKAAAPAPPQASAEATTLESGPAPRAGGALADKLRASRTASEPPPDSSSSEAIDEVEEDVIDLGSSKLVAQPVTEPDPPAPPPATPTAEAPGASSDPGRSAPPAPVEATAAAAAPAASESNQAAAHTREPVVAAPEAPSAAGPAIVEPAPAAVTPRDEVSPVSVRAEAPPAAIDSAGAVPGQPPNETTKASDAPKVDPQPDLAGAAPSIAQSVVNALPGGARTLEDTVAELLRPMLKEWLDENMPRIVQKALQKEEFKEPPSFQAPN
jgi:cell pole-organizing protein PopZ